MVKAGQASRLTTSYDGRVIDTDITAAQVALWNSGSKPVKAADILKPVVIHTDNNTPILEATIRKTSREILQLALNTDELQKGRVTVSWNILERNDGGAIQLIYAGNPNVQVSVDGVIEGQPQIVHQDSWQTTAGDRVVAYILMSIGVIMTAFVIFLSIKFYRRSGIHLDDWLMLGSALAILICGAFLFYITRDVGPPFGF